MHFSFFTDSVQFGYTHSGAKGVVKERMETMKSIAGAMKRIAGMRTSNKFQSQIVMEAVQDIAKDSLLISKQFPHGEFTPPSEALPAIHENWGKFLDLIEEMRRNARQVELRAVTAST